MKTDFKKYSKNDLVDVTVNINDFARTMLIDSYLGLVLLDREQEPQDISLGDLAVRDVKRIGISELYNAYANDLDEVTFKIPHQLRVGIKKLIEKGYGNKHWLTENKLSEYQIDVMCFVAAFLNRKQLTRSTMDSSTLNPFHIEKKKHEFFNNLFLISKKVSELDYTDEPEQFRELYGDHITTTLQIGESNFKFELQDELKYLFGTNAMNFVMDTVNIYTRMYETHKEHIMIHILFNEILNIERNRSYLHLIRIRLFSYYFSELLKKIFEGENLAMNRISGFIREFYELVDVKYILDEERDTDDERPWSVISSMNSNCKTKFIPEINIRAEKLLTGI